MNVKRILNEEAILLNLQGTTKDAIIQEMIDFLMAKERIKDREAALKAVMDREQKMSTGMQHGVAIPHGKTNSVERLVAMLALKREGIDFGSMDGKPSTIFLMTLSPLNQTGPHIQFLSEISQVLNDPVRRETLLAAQSVADVLRVLSL
jgi:fructose-specific phosphotransferase system IIA component